MEGLAVVEFRDGRRRRGKGGLGVNLALALGAGVMGILDGVGWTGLEGGFWLRRLRVSIWGVVFAGLFGGVGVMMVWEGREEAGADA